MTYSDLVKFTVAMIIMMNPLGSLSIFLELTKRYSTTKQRKTAFVSSITIILTMLITLWLGKGLLNILGITIPSFRFAGGIILLLMGLSMLQSRESPVSYNDEDTEAAKESDSIAIAPLALPIIIGPGAISTLIISAGDFPQLFAKMSMSVICLLLTIGMGAILYFAHPVANFLGASAMKVITRLMGMFIMAIAVGMLADGLIGLLPALH